MGYIKNIRMSLEAVRRGVQNDPSGSDLFARQLFFQKVGQIDIELDLSLWRGLTIPSGIAVGALEDTTSGNIQGGNSAEAAKLRRGENFSSPEPWANFAALQCSGPLYQFGVKLPGQRPGLQDPNSKAKTEIPNQVRDDKKPKNRILLSC